MKKKDPKKTGPVANSKKEAAPASAKLKPAVAAPAKTAAAKSAAVKPPPAPADKKKVEIPRILLEGDASPAAALKVSGPGARYALGVEPPAGRGTKIEPSASLPEGYGTQRLLLTARDPHWLYASWDLNKDQQKKYNSLSRDGHLVLRLFLDALGGTPFSEIHVHPESRSWFVYAGKGGSKYVAEIGYFSKDNAWNQISVSKATLTPPDALSDDTSIQFATIPSNVSFEKLIDIVQSVMSENVPLVQAIREFRATGHKGLPEIPTPSSSAGWSPAQAQALSEIVTMDTVRRVWIGSLEITELIRRKLLQEISSISASQMSQSLFSGGAVSSISSPHGGAPKGKGFWFNVNAELIIYGSTEPDAKVTIGGREIKLRPDGSFSYRFSLPDGQYELPAIAVSAGGDDEREADLKFSRKTKYRGEVLAHPQDPQLKIPHRANVA